MCSCPDPPLRLTPPTYVGGGQCSGQRPVSHPHPLSDSTPPNPPASPDPLPPKAIPRAPVTAATALTFTLDSRTWTAGGHSRASHTGPIRPGWPVSSARARSPASSPTMSWLTPLSGSCLSISAPAVPSARGAAPPFPDLRLAATSSFRPNSAAGETFLTALAAPAPGLHAPALSVPSCIVLQHLALQLPYLLACIFCCW